MSDEDFEDEPALDDEDLDEEELDEDFLDEDDVLGDEDDEEVVDLDETDEAESEVLGVVAVPGVIVEESDGDDEDDDVVDLDEELHPDDVEEALDVVLRERTVAAGLEEDEEDDDEPDDRGEAGTKIVPRRENEFLCKSCFLVLPRHQLADEKRMICRDCA